MVDQKDKMLFSVILAFRNEAERLEECLRSLEAQSLPGNHWELILVDGCSEDGSRKIAEDFVLRNNNYRLLENPEKLAVSGWNIGISISRGKYYYPASGHSISHVDYLKQALVVFKNNPDVSAVGGSVSNIGENTKSMAIAAACNTALALGGVDYRTANYPKETEVVGLGIYSRDLYDDIGPYKTDIARSGDWEFNYRARLAGHKLYINPSMKAWLYTRSSYKLLFIQQFKTGFWKIKVWSIHPKSVLPRHVIPSIFVVWCAFALSLIFLDSRLFSFMFVPILAYCAAVIYFSVKAWRREGAKLYLIVPTFPIIHFGYGLGFIAGVFRWGKKLATGLFRLLIY